MKPRENGKAGPVSDFLTEDHRRLETLLQSAVAHADQIDQGAYAQFRAGLLRHIGMEEKILLPAAQRLRGGEPLLIASKLRLDHGALATLLIPTPTAAIIATIRAVLKVHNTIEEGSGGLYETCDELAGSEAAQLLTKLQAAPEVTVLPHSDSPIVMNTVHRALERAGYDFREDEN
jgi:Hemerythrin HHE cation binding domain